MKRQRKEEKPEKWLICQRFDGSTTTPVRLIKETSEYYTVWHPIWGEEKWNRLHLHGYLFPNRNVANAVYKEAMRTFTNLTPNIEAWEATSEGLTDERSKAVTRLLKEKEKQYVE